MTALENITCITVCKPMVTFSSPMICRSYSKYQGYYDVTTVQVAFSPCKFACRVTKPSRIDAKNPLDLCTITSQWYFVMSLNV